MCGGQVLCGSGLPAKLALEADRQAHCRRRTKGKERKKIVRRPAHQPDGAKLRRFTADFVPETRLGAGCGTILAFCA